MTPEVLRIVAQRILKWMDREHPDEAAVLASLVVSDIPALGLFDKDEAGIAAFADINMKLRDRAGRRCAVTVEAHPG